MNMIIVEFCQFKFTIRYMSQSVVLFGSTGMLGRYVHHLLHLEGYLVKAVPREKNPCDMNTDQLRALCEGSPFVINCIGAIPQRHGDDDIRAYIKVNTKFPLKLEQACCSIGSLLIHITTDCVFDGTKGRYSELSPHTARDIYGVSKSLGELDHSCVIRTSIVGEADHSKGLLEWVRNRHATINGFVNHHWNGVTCLQLAKFIAEIIRNKSWWYGVRHYHSDDITKFQLIEKIIKTYDLNVKVIPFVTTQAVDRTLRSIYYCQLPPSIDVMLREQRDFTLIMASQMYELMRFQ